jgi:hypothetical protein
MNVLLQTVKQGSSMKTYNVLGIFWSLGAQQNFFINHKAADIFCLKNETVFRCLYLTFVFQMDQRVQLMHQLGELELKQQMSIRDRGDSQNLEEFDQVP